METLLSIRRSRLLCSAQTWFEIDLAAEDLYKLILQLPNGYRTIFNLFAIEGYSHKEISEMLKISENTSRTQYHKAKIYLQKKLTDYIKTI